MGAHCQRYRVCRAFIWRMAWSHSLGLETPEIAQSKNKAFLPHAKAEPRKNFAMIKISHVATVLFFALTVRAVLSIISFQAELESGTAFIIWFGIDLLFNSLLIVFSIKALSLGRASLKAISGAPPALKHLAWGLAFGLALVCLTLGENAVEAIIVANIDKKLAYSLWRFSPSLDPAPPFLSLNVQLFLFISVVLAPVAEEFFFRGILLRALGAKFGFAAATVYSSLIFMLLHAQSSYHLTAFLFSCILCYLYAVSRSLLACIVAHSVVNLSAYVIPKHMEFHKVRTIDQLDALNFWIPQMWMLTIAIAFMAVVIAKWQSAIRHADVQPISQA